MQGADPFGSTAAGMGMVAAPMIPARADDPGVAANVTQLRCPACGMMTMATPGRASVCFSCGQPLPSDGLKGGGGAFAPGFRASAVTGSAPVVAVANTPAGAVLRGTESQFSVREGTEVRVGRDPVQCPFFIAEPRVSAVHASLKFEGGQLLVRDETSNNGTWLYGGRLPPGSWTPVPAGSTLRFGPVEFAVQLES